MSCTFRLEVVTGGDPVRAFVRAVRALPVGQGEAWTLDVHHDDGCPAIDSSMPACTCEIVLLRARRAA